MLKPVLFCSSVLLLALFSLSSASANGANVDAGEIDKPLISTNTNKLQKDVRKESRQLAKLDRQSLKEKAKKGERLAQVKLGESYAKEAASLAFAPAAANEAMSDAVRWYSLAAQRGYPGAPSLDMAGISYFPLRAYR